MRMTIINTLSGYWTNIKGGGGAPYLHDRTVKGTNARDDYHHCVPTLDYHQGVGARSLFTR